MVGMADAAPETLEAASAANVTNLQLALAAGSGPGAIIVSSAALQTMYLTADFNVLVAVLITDAAARFLVLARRG
jgi:predicted MFS family arabinose efflux permease